MLDTILHAIAEPHRRTILSLVEERELSSGEIAVHFDITRPAISQHLKVLTDAGLLSVRREGTRRLYQARPEGLTALKTFLEEFWDSHLGLLKQEAEAEEQKEHEERRYISGDR